jgi:hypothetical protein
VKLGYVDVDAMLDSISWIKFQEWWSYSQLEPFDEKREDTRTAHIVSTIVNLFRGTRAPYPLSDFMLQFGKPFRPPQTWEEQKKIVFRYVGVREKDA